MNANFESQNQIFDKSKNYNRFCRRTSNIYDTKCFDRYQREKTLSYNHVMFKRKCRESQFPIGANEDYTDESNAFLKTISAEKDEDSDNDFNM